MLSTGGFISENRYNNFIESLIGLGTPIQFIM